MSFIIQELCWAWSSLSAHARDARKSAEQAGRMHASRLEISVGFRKNRNSWAAAREKLPRKKPLRAVKHSPELHYKRGEMQNMVSETQEHLLYTWEPPAFLYGLRWISAVRKTRLQSKLEDEASHAAPQQKRRAGKDKLSCNRDLDLNWEWLAALVFSSWSAVVNS